MNSTTRLLPTLAFGLLLTTTLACDDGDPGDQPSAELEAASTPDHLADLERQIEQEQGLELELVAEVDDGATILWTAVDEIAPDPAAGVCGGKWEYKSTVYECGECDVLGEEGKKYEHYKRWCWTGPGCWGCDDWVYTGWSCYSHLCDGSIAPSDGPTDVLAPANTGAAAPTPSEVDAYDWTEFSMLAHGELAGFDGGTVAGPSPLPDPDGSLVSREDPRRMKAALSWEAPADFSDIDSVAPPPEQGVCGGYWELKGTVDWQGCGTCTHTAPEPDREGNLGLWKKRWCWTGGCSGCEPWIVSSTQCYDNCE